MVDPISVSVLASTVVSSFLLPYVKRGAEAFAETLADKTAGAAAEHASGVAGRLWARVRQAFSGTEAQTITLFEQHPDQMREVLVAELERKLKEDQELRSQLSQLVETPGPDGQAPEVVIKNAGLAGVAIVHGSRFDHVKRVDITGVRHVGPAVAPPGPARDDPGPDRSGDRQGR
jgi:hypothetical protein